MAGEMALPLWALFPGGMAFLLICVILYSENISAFWGNLTLCSSPELWLVMHFSKGK